MISSKMNYNELREKIKTAKEKRQMFRNVLEKVTPSDDENFLALMRGYALYRARIPELVPENGTYKIKGNRGYYITKRDEITSTATAKLGANGDVEVTISTNDPYVSELNAELANKLRSDSLTLTDFIDYLYSIGVSKLPGTTYNQLDLLLVETKKHFPQVRDLTKTRQIELLEKAAEEAEDKGRRTVLATSIIDMLIEEKLHLTFEKESETGPITYHFLKEYKERDGQLKFINYYWVPKPNPFCKEVRESMSRMGLRDLLMPKKV